jgi:hypothetical protein
LEKKSYKNMFTTFGSFFNCKLHFDLYIIYIVPHFTRGKSFFKSICVRISNIFIKFSNYTFFTNNKKSKDYVVCRKWKDPLKYGHHLMQRSMNFKSLPLKPNLLLNWTKFSFEFLNTHITHLAQHIMILIMSWK